MSDNYDGKPDESVYTMMAVNNKLRDEYDRKNAETVRKFFDYANYWKVESDCKMVNGMPEVSYTAEISGVKATARTPWLAMQEVLEQIEKLKVGK